MQPLYATPLRQSIMNTTTSLLILLIALACAPQAHAYGPPVRNTRIHVDHWYPPTPQGALAYLLANLRIRSGGLWFALEP